MDALPQARSEIARKVRDLRRSRAWTQAQLATELGLSQSRLSEIERGQGSFTAEQFLLILRLFNTPTEHFVTAPGSHDAVLQNSLARLGAPHLRESTDALPSDRLRDAANVVREVLVSADSARLITALAPVLVENANHLNLRRLAYELQEIGLSRRLGWLIENTLEAVRQEIPRTTDRLKARYRRAEVVLSSALESLRPSAEVPMTRDILDPDIRSQKTLNEVEVAESNISRRWAIVTRLDLDAFSQALRTANGT